MINKMKTAQEAVAGIQDGMTIMVGGFPCDRISWRSYGRTPC